MTKQAATSTVTSDNPDSASAPAAGQGVHTVDAPAASEGVITSDAPASSITNTDTTQETTRQQEAHQQGAEGIEPAEDGKGNNKAGQEAAKYRRQLRDTEAEKDSLVGSVEALRKQLIAHNMPHGSKLNADALWIAGQNPADLFTKEGVIDQSKLLDAVKETHKQVGLRFGPDPVPASGTGSGHGAGGDGPSWSKVMNKSKR